jgi:hypothetical protein
MQDQHFMQQWNAGHGRVSTGLDRGLGRLGERLAHRGKRRKNIGDPYGIPTGVEAGDALSPAARASLRGLAASVITVALWMVVMALATPAPGLAAAPVGPMASVECSAHPFLA